MTAKVRRIVGFLFVLALVVVLAAVVAVFSPLLNRPKAFCYFVAGNIRAKTDDVDAAEALLEKALRLDPESFRALTGMGIVHRKRGEYAEARAFYEQALDVNPSHADAHTSLAVIYLVQGQDDLALASAQRAYELDPEYDVCVANLAVVYHYVGDLEKRDKYAREAASLGYDSMGKLQGLFRGEWTIRE